MFYEPTQLKRKGHVLLFITGVANLGKPNEADRLMEMGIAQLCGARDVMWHQIPNQPLLGSKTSTGSCA